MFVKVTTSGPRRYVQLVESYRDEAGRVKKRTVATLGRLDQLTGELDCVIDGLLKVAGREPVVAPSITTSAGATAGVSFESARALGNVWTLTEIWKELGFSDLRRVFRRTRHSIDVEALIRIMVLNRLCDPDSKLGVLRWLQTVALPDIDMKALTHQHLLRSMDALMDKQEALRLLRPGGGLLRMGPTRAHLMELRQKLYDEVRDYDDQKHLELIPPGMHLAHSETLSFPLLLADAQARADLLAMTPHGWRASAERRAAVIAEPFEVTVAIRYDWIEKNKD